MNAKARLLPISPKLLYSGLDVLVFLAWGGLLLKYSLSGQLRLLIHPNYFGLVFATSLILLLIGSVKAWHIFQQRSHKNQLSSTGETVKHITLLPAGWSSSLLLSVALLGWLIAPTPLTSQIALQRGISQSMPPTQLQPQTFRATVKPEERSLIDWVRTLNAYPEPDAYAGQKVKVSGFVIHLPELPDNYLFLSRFIITCCAVDAYPVGLPVKLSQSRNLYPPDTWLAIEGTMMTDTSSATGQRQLVIKAQTVQKIPTPADPYGY